MARPKGSKNLKKPEAQVTASETAGVKVSDSPPVTQKKAKAKLAVRTTLAAKQAKKLGRPVSHVQLVDPTSIVFDPTSDQTLKGEFIHEIVETNFFFGKIAKTKEEAIAGKYLMYRVK